MPSRSHGDRCPSALRAFAVAFLCLACFWAPTQAQTGRFDLLGPSVDIHVTRGDRSLPIASVPNLQPGDKIQVHADLPATQSVHLLLVVAFLRGTTNPPPDKWFTRIETWDKKIHGEGVIITVPDEAQQAIMFIAPETGGDFSTLRSAVRGRPGTFVRASQDLNEASFEQSRIERYVAAIKQVPTGSSDQLLDHSHKLAATLNLKPNDDCFKRAPDLQTSCLSQSGSQLLLDDGHGQTMAQALSTGATSDLIGSVAGTPVATSGGAASYSAYVGTVLDVVRLLSGLHTAKYQYIPSIAFPDGDALNLRLNTAPSFLNPKSVIVIALPAIEKAVTPPLQLQDPRHIACLLQPRMVLPLSGAPLVFATGYAHDLTLHLTEPGPNGRTDLPLVPDAYEGGLIVTNTTLRKHLGTVAPALRPDAPAFLAAPVDPSKPITTPPSDTAPTQTATTSQPLTLTGPLQGSGVVRGFWGFDAFEGPTLPLQRLPSGKWSVANSNELFTGRANTLLLRSDATACTAAVDLGIAGATPKQPLEWHQVESTGTHALAVKLPLEKSAPGGIVLAIQQYGTTTPQLVPLTAYSDAVHAKQVRVHAGDTFFTLEGSGLTEIKSAEINGISFTPAPSEAADGTLLRLTAPLARGKSKPPAFKAGDHGSVQITLNDGRSISVPYAVDAARPALTLLNTSFQSDATTGLPLTLGDPHTVPLTGKFSFALRSDAPAKFPRSEKIEVALADGSLSTKLSLADKTLVLQDAQTALGFLSPATVFGPSAFGPLQLRAVTEDGTVSDWQPLGTLVRTPVVQQVTCPARTVSPHTPPLAAGPARPGEANAPVPPPADAKRPPTSNETTPPANPAPPTIAATPCILSGSDLFLIDAVSPDSTFAITSPVPPGYAAATLAVPQPTDGRTLYLRLRDDPAHPATLTIPIPERHLARSAARNMHGPNQPSCNGQTTSICRNLRSNPRHQRLLHPAMLPAI